MSSSVLTAEESRSSVSLGIQRRANTKLAQNEQERIMTVTKEYMEESGVFTLRSEQQ